MPQIIDLGKIRFFYRGDWNNSTSYELNDVVRYGGASYVYKATTPSTGNNPNNDTYWDQMTSGFQYEQTYSASTQYQTNDVVTFGGQSYVAKADTTGNDPTNTNYWDILVAGLNHRGDWQAAETYYPNDLVQRGAIIYRSTSYHVASSVFETDRAAGEWVEFTAGARYRDTWTTNTEYLKNDYANDNLNLYVCTIDHTSGNGLFSQEPAGYWVLVVPGADYLPAQATNEDRLLSTDGTNPFWTDSINLGGSIEVQGLIYAGPSASLLEQGAGLNSPISAAGGVATDYQPNKILQFVSGNSASNSVAANIVYAADGYNFTNAIGFGIADEYWVNNTPFQLIDPHAGFILMNTASGTSGTGNLTIGTGGGGTQNRVQFAAGGFESGDVQMIIIPDEQVHIEIPTESTSPTTGALRVAGGAGISGNLNVLGDINAQGNQDIVGDVTIQGSITVQGGQFTTENLSSTDPLLFVGNGNETNNFDLGLLTEAKQPISGSVSTNFGSYDISASTVTLYTEDQDVTIKEITSGSATLTIGTHTIPVGKTIRVSGVDATFNGDYEVAATTSTTVTYLTAESDVVQVAATGNVQILIDTATREFVATDFLYIAGVGNTDVDGYRHITGVTETTVSFPTNVADVSLTTITPAATGTRITRSKYSGFVKDNFDGKWHLFNGLETRPSTSVDFYGTPGAFTTPAGYDPMKVGYIESVTGINIFDSATARDNVIDPIHGTIVYRTDLNVQEVYTGSTWDAIDPIHPFLLMGV